ncbi:MAG: acyl-CoA dehydrogenase family protein [Brevundimonas sp.]|uniref:acyl-CoA dehydrogenase family protein n=1 Tax=Brevundimonas sp. TaxID=1871086 RepID=UPI0024870E8E|nr:acyl-CoA dehydrogenase family protein [Brevundimonas sp.]MDI1326236.1 acyl-CoA dehydrogenase family protein [Brevundimonas sp.]
MDFRLTDTQTLIAETANALVGQHLQAVRGGGALQASQTTSALWPQLGELGLLGAEIDEADGGSGGTFEDLAVILQALGRGGGAGAFGPVVVTAAALVSRLGDAAQKAALLPAVVEGAKRVVLAHHDTTDQGADDVATTAIPASGGWKLEGRKAMVFAGDSADVFVVSAHTAKGLTLFLVPATAEGLSIRSMELYDGTGAADLELNDCFVPADARLGAEGDAGDAVAWALDRANAAFANEAIGLMAELCDMTSEYLKTREQFGQPIGKFQVLQHRMVDMRINLELARSMAILAAVAVSDPDGRRRSRDVSAARAAIGKASRVVGQAAIQLHGAIALTQEYPAGSFVKRLTLIERSYGDTRWHLERFAKLADPAVVLIP